MKASVIISYYKQPQILYKTLHIWTNQTFNHSDYEILIMDGAEDKDGIDIYKLYKKTFPNLRYFTYDGRVYYKCPVHSFNVGFRQARGDILIPTMEDRLTTFDAVEALYIPHKTYKNIFCTVLPYLMEGNDLETISWKDNPKLFWSIAKPTAIAKKEIPENETVMYSIPRNIMLDIKGYDERWRDYGYWQLELYRQFLLKGLKPLEVSWIINAHHSHDRHGTMNAHLYDRIARITQWEYIKQFKTNEGIDWGNMEGSHEL